MPSICLAARGLGPALVMLCAAGCARAQPADATAPTVPALTANVALTSQYVSRGFRQTWGKPAVQGGIDYALPGGWSAGTWMSSVSDKFIEGGSIEWDLYAGYAGARGDLNYGVQVYYYLYPGAKLQYAGTSYDYGEVAVSLGYKWFSAKYWLTWTPDYFGYNSRSLLAGDGLHSRGSGYAEVNGTFDLGNGASLQLHFGHERVRNFAAYSFRDARVALSRAFDGGWTLTGAVTRGWGRTDVYDRYTTGAQDSAGRLAVSNPLETTFLVALSRAF
ncbi:TorF family putative porin [Massilia sp. METH4]|uniref:TorF family putative porin n=1 Tax=Massilia sp. METH4 TaxID=3123041 RepID=UPI0030CD8450